MEPYEIKHEEDNYKVVELTGAGIMDVNRAAFKAAEEQGLAAPDGQLWNICLMAECVKKVVDENEAPVTFAEIEKMPAKLYQKLFMASQRLNTLTEEEQSFLSKPRRSD